MNTIMTNNDARLYILINEKWRKIPTTEFSVSVRFSPSSYGISGEVYARTFIGQGGLEGSFKTPFVLEDDLNPEVVLISKYLQKLTLPEHQSILNGHQLKVVQLNPRDPNKVYREVTFTAALSPKEFIAGRLNDLTYLSFDISFQGDLKIVNNPIEKSDSWENNLVPLLPGKIFFEPGTITKNGDNAVLTNPQFNILDENGLPIKIKAGALIVRIFQSGIVKPVYTIRVGKDDATAKSITFNIAPTSAKNLIVIKTNEYGEFSVPSLVLKNQERFVFDSRYKYWIDAVTKTINLKTIGKLDTSGDTYTYIPNAL